jgi:hypothetical protein
VGQDETGAILTDRSNAPNTSGRMFVLRFGPLEAQLLIFGHEVVEQHPVILREGMWSVV